MAPFPAFNVADWGVDDSANVIVNVSTNNVGDDFFGFTIDGPDQSGGSRGECGSTARA